VPIVGSLHSASAGYIRSVGGFGESPEQTGFIDGKNVTIEYRRADGHTERLPARAADFVQPTKFEMVITPFRRRSSPRPAKSSNRAARHCPEC
jgi:hypothetical protein